MEKLLEIGAAKTNAVRVPVSLPDVICLSHLRWDFVFQRPQHLLTRFSRDQRVFYFEEPIHDSPEPRLEILRREPGVRVVVPHLPAYLSEPDQERLLKGALNQLLEEHRIREFVLWYYTPMALGFSNHLRPRATIYDCMDELANFHFAPPTLQEREKELFRRADLVFTGGQSLYEAKKDKHPRVHAFPSSVEVQHFSAARLHASDPADQAAIPRPRLGFFGVIDERMDLDLIRAVAELRPDWQLVFLGPVCKISPDSLPKHANVHFLGQKTYAELPKYLSGWDVALLPFARNDATRFISPTKTPEYLAAGKPVVSTSIRDVVRPYGENGLVYIADTPETFVAAIEKALDAKNHGATWLAEVDRFLSQTSWDQTWKTMRSLVWNRVIDRDRSESRKLVAQ